uniref:Reverse transcriptase n=1 Tax=Gouania willdenowi TaxID=441366 RepID=A0A8C5ERI4_GOUWI
IISYLQKPDTALPLLMSIFDDYGKMSGYKVNINKTQILPIMYKASKEIRQLYKLKWKAQSIRYLGVVLTQDLSKLYEVNYNIINNNVQKDVTKWSHFGRHV